jgi:hypothetical protein
MEKTNMQNYTNIGSISKTIAEYLDEDDLMQYYVAANHFNPKVHIIPSNYTLAVFLEGNDDTVRSYASCEDLKILNVSGCHNISKRVWKGISSNVTSLNIANCHQVDDISLKYIADSFKQLEALTVTKCNITDVGMKFITRLARLKSLHMGGCSRVSLDEVSKIKNLTTLSAPCCKLITNTSLRLLAPLKLTILRLSGNSITRCKYIGKIVTLIELSLDYCSIEDEFINDVEIAKLSTLINLKTLSLSNSGITSTGLKHIQKLPSLESLDISSCDIIEDYTPLLEFSKLQTLQLPRHFFPEDLYCLGNMTNLTHLYLSRLIDDTHMELMPNKSTLVSLGQNYNISSDNLEEFVNLRLLNLSQCYDFTALEKLIALTNLEVLDLHGMNFDSKGMRAVYSLTKLTQLDLSGPVHDEDESIYNDKDKTLLGISKLSNLTYLNLSEQIKVTTEVMIEIGKMSKLHNLSLNECTSAVDDSTLKDCMAGLSNLTKLDLTECTDITIKGISQLTKLVQLKNLFLEGIFNVDDKCVRLISNMSSLATLSLSSTGISESSVIYLSKLTNLLILTLSDTKINGSTIRRISTLPKLRMLSINSCNIKSGDLSSLSTSKTLCHLSVNRCQELTNTDLEDIMQIANLNTFYANKCPLMSIEYIKQIPIRCRMEKLEFDSGNGDSSEEE